VGIVVSCGLEFVDVEGNAKFCKEFRIAGFGVVVISLTLGSARSLHCGGSAMVVVGLW